MNLWRQFIASCLAFCLLFSGAVGLNPVLHRWVEHGGTGTAHIHHHHSSSPRSVAEQDHDDSGVHNRERMDLPSDRGLLRHNRPFTVALPDLDRLWHAIGEIFPRTAANDARRQPQDSPDHTHHSLAQLLASGLIDIQIDLPLLEKIREPFVVPSPALSAPFLPSDWNAQTASRAPPLTAG